MGGRWCTPRAVPWHGRFGPKFKRTKSELLKHYAAANARDPPRALTAVTTAPSPVDPGIGPNAPTPGAALIWPSHHPRMARQRQISQILLFLVLSQRIPPDARGGGAASWPESAPLGGFDERHQRTGPVGGRWCTPRAVAWHGGRFGPKCTKSELPEHFALQWGCDRGVRMA